MEAAQDRLQAVIAAQRDHRDDDRWQALRELLESFRQLDEQGKATLGTVTWYALRAASSGGRTFAALVWVRGLMQDHRADVEQLGWLTTAEFMYLGQGRWQSIETRAAAAGDWVPAAPHVAVLLWPQFVDLPPGQPEKNHRDEWYDKLVAMRALVEPLQVAVQWVQATLQPPGPQ